MKNTIKLLKNKFLLYNVFIALKVFANDDEDCKSQF